MFTVITVRNEVAKVMFLQVCVCPRGGGCLGGSAPRGGAWSWGGSAPRGVGGVPGPQGGWLVFQHALRQTPPGEMATAADGTHPTGMHSCC